MNWATAHQSLTLYIRVGQQTGYGFTYPQLYNPLRLYDLMNMNCLSIHHVCKCLRWSTKSTFLLSFLTVFKKKSNVCWWNFNTIWYRIHNIPSRLDYNFFCGTWNGVEIWYMLILYYCLSPIKKLRLFGFIFGNIEKHKTLSFTPFRIKAYNVVHARTHT